MVGAGECVKRGAPSFIAFLNDSCSATFNQKSSSDSVLASGSSPTLATLTRSFEEYRFSSPFRKLRGSFLSSPARCSGVFGC